MNRNTFGEGRRWQLVFVPVTVSSPQIVELASNEAAQCAADHGPRVWCLCDAASEQINVVHVLVDAAQRGNRRLGHHVVELIERLDGRQAAKLAPLDVSGNTVVTSVLDNLRRQIETGT